MISKEKKRKIEERKIWLEQRLETQYETAFEIAGGKCFKSEGNTFFLITPLSWADAIVVEYALSEEEASKNLFEDGDLFYMDELNREEMLKKILMEINES